MKLVFFGTPQFAVPTLEALFGSEHEVVLVVAQPDRPAGRGMKLQVPPVAELARARGVELMQPAKVRDAEFLDRVRAARPDLGVVIAYGRILPPALLAIPAHGFINVHASLLPKYRGAAPIQRAIEAGETTTGVSIMRVDEELDHGPVFAFEELAIKPDETSPQLSERLAVAGARLLVEVVDRIAAGNAPEAEQDHAAATLAPKIEKDEGLVQWSMPAQTLYNRFRAFQPWPGVRVMVKGEPLKLVSIEPKPGLRAGEPGRVVSVDRESVFVTTLEGALRLSKVQRPGKSVVSAAEFARAAGIESGDFLQ